jgi:hypothetical protein
MHEERGDRSFWRAGGSGSRGSWGSGGRSGQQGSGSDAPSWRRVEGKEGAKARGAGEEDEVTSPIKKNGKDVVPSESVRKQLSLGTEHVPQEKRQELAHTIVNSSMNIMHADQNAGEAGEGYNKKELQEVPRKKMTYKKIIRVEGGKTSANEGQDLSRKGVSQRRYRRWRGREIMRGRILWRGSQTNVQRKRDWRTSPARTNEDSGVELPGVGQSPGSSGTSGSPEVGGSRYPVPVGNQNG